MLSLFILIAPSLARNPTAVFPIAATKSGELYMTFSDLQQLKIMFLSFAVYALWNMVRWLFRAFSTTEKKRREDLVMRLLKLEDNDEKILETLKELTIRFGYMKDAYVSSDEVRQITRDEINYLSKLKDKK